MEAGLRDQMIMQLEYWAPLALLWDVSSMATAPPPPNEGITEMCLAP